MSAATEIPVEHYHLDWFGLALWLGLVLVSLIYALVETRPVRRLMRQAHARCQELIDLAMAEPWPDVRPLIAVPDPESLDATRPEDLDVCWECQGKGWISVCDDGEWSGEECRTCAGSGVAA